MRRIGWIAAGTLAGFVLALQLPSMAQDTNAPPEERRSITVTGTATVTAQPDEAVVMLGVHTQASTAEEALADNAKRMDAVLGALRDAGLGADDVATTTIGINPIWGQDGRAVTGYQVDDQIQATIRDLSAVGRTIDAAVAAGANVASGVTFQVADDSPGTQQALARAVEDAMAKADALASAAGAGIGPVLTIAETTSPAPGPWPVYAGAEDVAAPSTPIQPPTIETQVSVTVTWSLV